MHTKPRRPFSKIKLMIALGLFLALGTIVVMSFLNAMDPFRKLRITIDNQSDYDITQIKTGITHLNQPVLDASTADKTEDSDLLYTSSEEIVSEEKVKFTPKLQFLGESSVYVILKDSRGKTYTKTACGYTESVSGTSLITITNENITVKENCT
ncbi:hypothetical protein [Paenibacillus sp. FSL R7-0272]|uniref:hypothetical protein n=1 Tax=Paenibacillus sp. FSL R7-0272 TaxID=2921679 RepID=UPI0030EB241D